MVGTRWVRRGRSPGGLDCNGLSLFCAGLIGTEHDEIKHELAEITDGVLHEGLISAGFQEQPLEEMIPGNLLTFVTEGEERHMGILVEPGWLVHVDSDGRKGRVVRSRLGIGWHRRLARAYRFPPPKEAPW